jgi:hypothetical protein
VAGEGGDTPFVLIELGREADWLAATEGLPATRWDEAGLAAARGDLVTAAEKYAEIGARFMEAWARLLAAERGEIAQLEPARAYFSSVGATPFLARCDAVLAASA